jgi:hypothetical protein
MELYNHDNLGIVEIPKKNMYYKWDENLRPKEKNGH